MRYNKKILDAYIITGVHGKLLENYSFIKFEDDFIQFCDKISVKINCILR